MSNPKRNAFNIKLSKFEDFFKFQMALYRVDTCIYVPHTINYVHPC